MLDEDHYGLQDIKDRILVRSGKLMLHAYMFKLKLQVKHFNTSIFYVHVLTVRVTVLWSFLKKLFV